MTFLEKAAFENLQFNAQNFSVRGLVDLACLSNKKIALEINRNQYIDLLASYGWLLNSLEVLVVANKSLNINSPTGFYSVYNRLSDKFSISLYNGLKNINLLVFVKGVSVCNYRETVKAVELSPKTSFENTIKTLKSTGYSQNSVVKQVNSFCIKGGIIDFYSPVHQHPVRAYFYDKKTKFVFYNLETGLPVSKKIKSVWVNKQKESTSSINIRSICEKYKFFTVSSEGLKTKKINFIKEVSENNFIKNKNNSFFLDKLHFSFYKIKNKLYAPVIYKNTSKPVLENDLFLSTFEKGDFVCHEDFGVGCFLGFQENDDSVEDYVKIQYLDGSVNVSVKHLFKLSFVSRETNQKISALNKKGLWKRKVKTITKGASIFVDSLVDMYQKKQKEARPNFPFCGEWEEEFLKAFPYIETKDQDIVWGQIKKDLSADFPMSRLLCGDVGFGKTELALRSTFRVVANGGKVLVLCPTSVLVNQHFKVFVARFKDFGVSVGCLLGGASNKIKNETKSAWVGGLLDVLISTTAALYDDVFIKLSSFFIVDEEHRFGVKQKEVLVNKFVNKDVLFMSATPIPRTLHLSLSGFHNISTLSSPPLLRKPINTVVSYFSKNIIKQNIDFELSRGGQVFYLHNRVETIDSVKRFLLDLCPAVKVGVIHSKLGHKKNNSVITGFINKKFDLLLCSSIIGSGVDIPNANTIIINNSHLFGVAQLHQFRGRVGRGDVQGFAYLLVPNKTTLDIKAKKRLQTIENNSSLGSGYNIAKKDLELRGGGTVFGYNQSGSSYDVGYEFYSKIVSGCLNKKINKTKFVFIDSFVYKVSFVCRFEDFFIKDSFDRLRLYRELSSIYSKDSVLVFVDKLKQVYGALPISVSNLINMRLASFFCVEIGVYNLVCAKQELTLFFNNSFLGVDSLVKFLDINCKHFDVLNFNFNMVNNKTNIKIFFKKDCCVDGLFVKLFVEGFYEFYKK